MSWSRERAREGVKVREREKAGPLFYLDCTEVTAHAVQMDSVT